LNKILGKKNASYIFNAVRGIDYEPVSERAPAVQFSRITTLKTDTKDFEFLSESLDEICIDLYQTISDNKKTFKSVGIQFVQSDLSNKTKSRMLKNPTSSIEELKKTAMLLLHEALADQELSVRRLGVRVSELADITGQRSIDNFF
ncbi:MAG: DNA polymerase IV, partial [Candidatus Nitrosotenuis sp.]